MDKIFNNLGLYDFFAIWGSGSICLMYGLGIEAYFSKTDVLMLLKDYSSDFSLLFIFIISLAGYLLGTVLDGVGKCGFDILQPKNPILKISDITLKSSKFDGYKRCDRLFHPIECMKQDFLKKTEEAAEKHKDIMLSDAMSYINRSEKSDNINKSYGLFGFSRAVCVFMFSHGVLMLIKAIIYMSGIRLLFMAFDLIIALIMLIRTARFYYIWLRESFNLYTALKKE